LSYLSLTERDRDEMLAAIGVSSVEELFRDIPEGVRFGRELALEPPLSEQELSRHLEELAARNVDTSSELSFLGAAFANSRPGCRRHGVNGEPSRRTRRISPR
jgi:glycine dehydrogenase subunit 1